MGTLEDRLHGDMVAAMKARDTTLTTTLRMAIAALKNEKVAGKEARELSEDDEVKVLQREVRTRKDSAQAYTDGGRRNSRPRLAAEADVIGAYLPAMLADADLDALVGRR